MAMQGNGCAWQDGQVPASQAERLEWLVRQLLAEEGRYAGIEVPADEDGRFRLYRSLVNVRPPRETSERYLAVEDAYLQERARERGTVDAAALPEAEPGIALWQGDITRLAADAIVNAANSQMLGCFVPCHGCIDNAIHTAAGVRLRLACAELMATKPGPEPTGVAEVTPGFDLPAAHVLHTVGPIVPTHRPHTLERKQLASCYRSCLDLATNSGLRTVAFCCISTGEFGYPPREAAKVATDTVRAWLSGPGAGTGTKVVFDVFSDADRRIYEELLG